MVRYELFFCATMLILSNYREIYASYVPNLYPLASKIIYFAWPLLSVIVALNLKKPYVYKRLALHGVKRELSGFNLV